jgi:hypothetical protein
MANALISYLDLAKRSGGDQEVGLLEDTITYAPELSTVMGRPIKGTQYKTVHRALPTVSFRAANTGSNTVKGAYRQTLKECFIIDAQLQADKAVVDAEGRGEGPEGSVGDILVDEAQGVIMATYITVGSQFYYGLNNDANGFTGIAALTPSSNAAKNLNPVVVKAGGSTANVQTSAYLIWENIRGAHFIFGNNSALTMLPEWRIQQVLDTNSKPYTAYVNNLQGWIGFSVNHPNSVARIGNINLGTDSKPLTDNLVAQLLSYMPLQMRQEVLANANTGGPNKWGPGLKMFMSPTGAYSLQQSRSPVSSGVGTAITAAGELKFADLPTASNGVPIVLTDSVVNTEAVIS